MNKEEIEELAFKDRKELANLNELDLLEIIEFLQLDRKQWINQYSTAHNDYVDLQQENKKQKEVIDEAINAIDLVIELIKQQPTKDDRWILDRLNGFKIILEDKEVSE